MSHMEQVAEAVGIWPKEYEPIPPPVGTDFIWDVFWELRNTAASGFSGPEKLNFHDFSAWQEVRGVRLGNYVIDALLEMDSAYLKEWYRKAPNKAQKKPKAPVRNIRGRHGR